MIVPRNLSDATSTAASLAQLAAHAGDDVLARFELAAETVDLAEVVVIGSGVPAHEQHPVAVPIPQVAERADDRRERHAANVANAGPAAADGPARLAGAFSREALQGLAGSEPAT